MALEKRSPISRDRRLTTVVALALTLWAVQPCAVRAEDTPAAEPEPADTGQLAASARADTLSERLNELYEDGRYAEATPLAREILAVLEGAFGGDHLEIASSLHKLGVLLKAQGIFGETRSLFERALAIRERALGKDHPDVASTLNSLAVLRSEQGAYAEARPLHERALAIWEKALGKHHPDVATSLNNLAEILSSQGAYAEALPLHERALAIWEKALGKDHPDVASSLSNLAVLLSIQGAYAEARSRHERALAIREKALGEGHPAVAESLSNLAQFLVSQGAYDQARPLYDRAIAIDEKELGEDHPNFATDLDNLANLLKEQGVYAEARPLIERALAIREKTLGKDHPDFASSLNNLAALLSDQGAYREAQPLLERALGIKEKALGKDHPDVASSLSNLAVLLSTQGAYAEAKPLHERALAIRENALGKDHRDVASSLNNLATLLFDRKAYAEARPLHERALAIREKLLGKDHPDVATSLNNLGSLLDELGAHAEARQFHVRALAVREKTLGKHHPDVAVSVNNLAGVLRSLGAYAEARPLYECALVMTEAHVRAQLSALSARQRLGLLRSTRYRLDNWVRFAPQVGLSGYPEVLRLRGLVARAEAAERVLSRRATGDDRRTQEVLAAAQRRAARLANEVPPSLKPEVRAAWQKAYAEACAERERLTLELTERIAPLRVGLERLDLSLADVQAQLGPDSALVDFLRVGNRYVAWIVRAAGDPIRIDVGAADAIEVACGEFVRAIVHETGEVESMAERAAGGATLRTLVWNSIESMLGDGVNRVVICPDAALAALPFGSLPGKQAGRFLIDGLAISYVMNAQDLVPWKDAPPVGTGALVIGGVDYEHADVGTKDRPLPQGSVGLASVDRAPRGGTFTPIPQTKVEAESLSDRFGKDTTRLILGSDATEARVRDAVRGKRFVHIATHGFAREDLLANLYSRRIEEAFTSADVERQLSAGHDPMLLSGLAMAGANPREGAAGDDGILTALEASYLDLDGVELVTLSACETAKGTPESGEGVQGLVSAFQMAGARRVVASLWRVDDEGTRRLMEGFYERMLRKENPLAPADALAAAQHALRNQEIDVLDVQETQRLGREVRTRRRPYAAPRFWAAFVCYERR